MASISGIQSAGTGQAPLGPAADAGRRVAPEAVPAPAVSRATAAERPQLDESGVQALVADLQEAIDNATVEPHQVGFRQDSRTKGFVIEIRNLDGSLVRQFPPEKVLNLRRKLADLSGMVVDETT